MKKTYINPDMEVVVICITQPLMAGSALLTDTSGLEGLGDGGDVIGDVITSGDADVREFFSDDEDFEF